MGTHHLIVTKKGKWKLKQRTVRPNDELSIEVEEGTAKIGDARELMKHGKSFEVSPAAPVTGAAPPDLRTYRLTIDEHKKKDKKDHPQSPPDGDTIKVIVTT